MTSRPRPWLRSRPAQPPDFLFGLNTDYLYGQWAAEGRLIDLSDVIGPFASLFDPDALRYATRPDATASRGALVALPIGFGTNHIHVWRNLLEQGGFTLDDIPRQWEAFWSFWCDQVQPAVRRATGRNDLWGVGLAMSAAASDTDESLLQFELAYGRPGSMATDALISTIPRCAPG
jgi:multiple sugar transport system substrate-binding protein